MYDSLIAESTYTYDAAGRLTQLTHSRGATTLADYAWVYDAVNRITQLTSPDGTSNYSYDDREQLTDAEHSYQTDESYSYDDNGNRTNTGYQTGDNNQLLSDGKYNYEYDAEGNRTKRTEIATGEVTSYEWDYHNRLLSVATLDSNGNFIKSVEYTYDAFDRRLSKSVDSDADGTAEAEVERLVYDGDHIALVFDGEGNQTHRYLHGVQVDQILAEEDGSGEVLWALTDNQGTLRDVVDHDGNVQNHIIYDSFGQVTSETNSNVNFRFGYTGRELDEETGLYYYRARYYDAATGRFVSEDPIGFAGGDENLYRYVGNSPTNGIDPSGLEEGFNLGKLVFDGAVAVAGAVGAVGAAVLNNLGNEISKNLSQLRKDKIQSLPPGTIPQGTPPYPGLSHEAMDLWKNPPYPRRDDGLSDLTSPPPFPPNHADHERQQVETFPNSCPAGDLFKPNFESNFRGPAAKGFDWEHIIDGHAPWGKTANQSGKKDIFEGLTENEIKKTVQDAWKNREKIKTQKDPINGDRIKYRGVDPNTGKVIEMWQNQKTKIVETAYPISPKK